MEKEAKVAKIKTSYEELVLLVHTDEPMICSDQFAGFQLSEPSQAFERIYLLFSYEPAKNVCPMVRLQ